MEAKAVYERNNIESNNLARRMLEEVIAMCPENPEGYVTLGYVYHADYWLGNTKSPQKALEKSMELAQKAIAIDESIASAHRLLSSLYSTRGEHKEAIAAGERNMALDPGGPSAIFAYARALRVAFRAKEAIPLLEKVIRLNPLAPFLFREFGHTLRDAGRFEDAVSAYKKAIQVSPNDTYAHMGLAATYKMMGGEKEARAEAAEVLRINPKYAEDFAAMNPAYKNQSEADKIDNVLRKAIIWPLVYYAGYLSFSERPEEAISVLQKEIQFNPLAGLLHRTLGFSFRNAGRFEESVSAYKKAIQLMPDDFYNHVLLAITYVIIGREKDAHAEAAIALRMNPNFSVDSWKEGIHYEDQSQQEKIVSAARKAGFK